MHFGFSYVGLLFLVLLLVPNLLWTKHQPRDYGEYAKKENRTLVALERIGEVLVSCLVLIFRDFNVQTGSPRLFWLAGVFALMILYEIFWVRYFRSEKTMADFYRSLAGVPVAGATLPVAAAALLALYGRNPILLAAVILLGIGHIGIHLQHRKALSERIAEETDKASTEKRKGGAYGAGNEPNTREAKTDDAAEACDSGGALQHPQPSDGGLDL